MAKLTLISAPTCPYVQRAIITLNEKGQPFDVIYVDLENKPDWFLALSPLGKVPVLKVERPGLPHAVLFESSVIVEYLEETVDGPKLHPADPLDRAQNRAWMEFCSSLISDLFKYATAQDEAEQAKAREAVVAKFIRLEHTLEGPFFNGADFSVVDAVMAPALRQIDTIGAAAGPLDLLDGLPKVAAWRVALAARPSVIAAVPDDYAERYLGRLRRMGSRLLAA